MYILAISLQLVSAVSLFFISLSLWKYRDKPITRVFLIFVISLQVWFIEFALEIGISDLHSKVILSDMQFLSIAFFPLLWLLTVLYYIDRTKYIKPVIIFGGIIPVLTNIAVWTNGFHHLFRMNPYIDYSGAFPVLVNDYGFWYYYIDTPFRHICGAISFILLITTFIKWKGVYRKQVILMIIGFSLPMIMDIVYVTKIGPIPEFSLSSIASTVSAGLIAYSIRRYKLFTIVPIARETAFDHLFEKVLVLDRHFRIIDYNLPAKDLFINKTANILGIDVDKIEENWGAEILKMIEDGDNLSAVHKEIFIKGETQDRVYDTVIYPIHSKKKWIGYSIIFHDSTKRVEIQRELEEMNSLKDRLITIISHDFRGPMGSIINLVDFLRDKREEPELFDNLLVSMKDQVSSIYTQLENLLTWMKNRENREMYWPENLNVRDIIEENLALLNDMAVRKNIIISLECPSSENELAVYADWPMTSTIIRNLISNAVKFTSAGGSIKVKVESSDDMVRISVADTGIGMTKSTIASIYSGMDIVSARGTDSEKGTGIGLALSIDLAEKNKGNLEIDSTPGRGSTISLSLPVPKDL